MGFDVGLFCNCQTESFKANSQYLLLPPLSREWRGEEKCDRGIEIPERNKDRDSPVAEIQETVAAEKNK